MEIKSKIGLGFEELSQEEMDFITGAKGAAQPYATPTTFTLITPSSAACVSGSLSALSGLVSYTKSCI
ncbi:lichenicidin A2 family type 2 lantibiotic [Oceanivirga salmonicida]|uniref:lichenicidin A2 family type 2 lantibiotic n=1 Tax=Oceanivirga salmonicida TaxID=1769291 RepID=UPI00083336A1|nr:mersacidin family lantibiotic [Oceanivirga salmonicida]